MADVDILIPHFRDIEGLSVSLNSVFAQTYTGTKRIVIVDDGSDADTYRLLRAKVEALSGEVVLLHNSFNRGRPYTRNRLLDAVQSPYLAWLDAGDLWYRDKLALQFDRFQELRTGGQDEAGTWLTCDYDWRWVGREAELVEQAVDTDQLKELFLGKKLRAYLWSLLCPSSSFKALGWFDERLPRLQDLDIFIRFVAAGGRLDKPRFTPARALCVYEKSDLGRDARQISRCNQLIFDKYAPLYHRYGSGFVRQTRVNAELVSARFAKNNAERGLAAYFVARAAAVDPVRAARQVIKKGIGL